MYLTLISTIITVIAYLLVVRNYSLYYEAAFMDSWYTAMWVDLLGSPILLTSQRIRFDPEDTVSPIMSSHSPFGQFASFLFIPPE
jgi:cation transporter-like permease